MKKLLVAGLAAVLAASCLMVGCSKNKDAAASSGAKAPAAGKVLNIYVWNEEFQGRVRQFYPGYNASNDTIGDVKVNWVITPNANNAYQNKLDEVLLQQENAAADDKVDIFLVEADYALKYTDTPYTLDVKKDVGLTDADLSRQYKYTKDIMTTPAGILKGVSWQACPAGVIYRRSIAKDVLGTDDPDQVQNYLSDWAKFDGVAKQAKDKGYIMVSGYDDDFRVFSDNVKSPWVIGNKINIDPSIREWISQTKTYTDNGYNNKASLWSPEQWAGAKKDGKVMCYFGPAWFIDFSLAPQTKDNPDGENALGNGSYGDWAFCKGPQGYSWGGTWICGAAGTDNIDLVKDIMLKMTCDDAVMTKMAEDVGEFANNEVAMTKIANGSYANAFLGGQNHIKYFLDSAKSIDKSNISPYDQGMTEKLQAAMKDYYDGKVTEDQAWENFYKSILETYPNLTR
ncbi:MAG TPA: ABC transporter substrate-binding protein [Treponema sp.]|nr:ABC transporter substrate-binding protein [Treponema sp.]